MLQRSVLTALSLSIVAFEPMAADTVRTRQGAEYVGEVRMELLRLAAVDGELEIPLASIRSIRSSDRGLEVVLADGTTVAGTPAEPSVKLAMGLTVRSIPYHEVEIIEIDAMPPDEQIRRALAAGEFAPTALAEPEMGSFETACPMRLELLLPLRPPANAWRSVALRSFQCDGAVSVPALALEVRAPKRGAAKLRVELVVLVRPPQDKRTDLAVELLFDGEPIGEGGRAGLSTEEGRTTPARFEIALPPGAYERWRAGLEEASMRLVVASRDD